MNTEPASGDDLQKMLVSMKTGISTRIAQEPRRKHARHHWALVIAFVALLGLGGASGAVALGLVPQPFAAAPTPAATPTPTPPETTGSDPVPVVTTTPTAEPSVSSPPTARPAAIPTTCQSAVDPSDYSRFFGSMPRDQFRPVLPGAVEENIYVPLGADFEEDAALACHWSTSGSREDSTNLFFRVGSATAAQLDSYATSLEKDSYVCTNRLEGKVCQRSSKNTVSGEVIDTTLTFFVRDGIYIDIEQSHVPTNGLLESIVGQIWK